MAERILRSPGATTRELDLSAPGSVTPQGVPAGIIGTAEKGPAFVPINFATANEFANLFGETKGVHFGAMAVNEWMRNARSGVYIRTLGIGNGKKATSGVTHYAGFVPGFSMRDHTDAAAAGPESDGGARTWDENPYAYGAAEATFFASSASISANPFLI